MADPRQLTVSPFQSDLLDLSRWVAAFLVVIEHLRSLMFADYAGGSPMGLFGKMFYFLTGFGHQAVMVFFVMSGFLVGGKVLERLAQGRFAWQKYSIDRISRLYAVYVLALLLCGTLDYLGYHFMNRFGLYDHSFSGPIAVVSQNFHQNLSIPIFTGNLLMCQTILVPVFGSNGPLWSLANEFWYYLAGPILFTLLFVRGPWKLLIAIGALVLLVWFLPLEILIYSLVWLLGAALYFFNKRSGLPLWLALVLLLGSLTVSRFQWLKVPYLGNFLIAIGFALVINSAAGSSRRLPWNVLSRKAADFSYSVYLCHFPFLLIVLSALYEATGTGLRGPRTLLSFSLFFFVLMLAYLWCYGVSLVTERQTPRIRQFLYRRLGQENARQWAADHRPREMAKAEIPAVSTPGLPTTEQ